MLLLLHPVFCSLHTLGFPRTEQTTPKCQREIILTLWAQVYQEKLINTFILLDFPQNSYLNPGVVDSDICLFMRMLDLALSKTLVLSIIYFFCISFPPITVY